MLILHAMKAINYKIKSTKASKKIETGTRMVLPTDKTLDIKSPQ
jgi:hypothetical protein